jgi:hypothetical protein
MKTFASRLLAAALLLLPSVALGSAPVKVDVLYMNHGPLQTTLDELKGIFGKYGSRVTVAWHDVDSDDGAKFMAAKKLSGHIPLVLWVNDSYRHRVEGRDVSFTGFPTGSGPAFFQGKWTLDELRKALDQITAGK